MPEAERLLSLVEAAGYRLRASDSGRLAVRRPLPDTTDLTGPDGYVAVHVGGSAPARRLPVRLAVEATAKLAADGDPRGGDRCGRRQGGGRGRRGSGGA